MKILITTLFLVAGLISLCAQTTVYYGYDAAGNRTSRTINLPPKTPDNTATELSIVHKDQLNGLEYSIYPNPTQGELKIEIKNWTSEANLRLSVHDLSGKLLLQQNILSEATILDLEEYSHGTYLLIIYSGNNKHEWKIIKD